MMTSIAERSPRLKWLIGIGLVNLATFTWATNMILGRWLRDDIGPFTLAAARFLIASVCFVGLLHRRPQEERSLGRDRWLLLGMALSGVVIFAPSLYLGLRFTTAVNATLINGLAPLITGLMAALLIREPMSRREVMGAIVGLVGVASLISSSFLTSSPGTTGRSLGDLIVLGSVILWGLYSLLGRQVMHHRTALSATAFSVFLGLPVLLLAAVWEVQTFPTDDHLQVLLAVVYIGIAPTLIGFLAWNTGVRRLGPSGAMIFYNTLPLYGALLGVFFLGESIGVTHLVGGVLIVGGGLWAAFGRSESHPRT